MTAQTQMEVMYVVAGKVIPWGGMASLAWVGNLAIRTLLFVLLLILVRNVRELAKKEKSELL